MEISSHRNLLSLASHSCDQSREALEDEQLEADLSFAEVRSLQKYSLLANDGS